MAILIAWGVDRSHPDPAVLALTFQRGDVIDVLPGDHPFGVSGKAHPNWVVLNLPGVSVAEGESFLGGTFHPVGSGLLPGIRASRLDLAALPADHAATTYADLDAARVMVDPTPEPGGND